MKNIKIIYHLYELRKERGLSVRDLEELSGVSKSQISNIENGLMHPTVLTLCLLSLALEVAPYRLFTLETSNCP